MGKDVGSFHMQIGHLSKLSSEQHEEQMKMRIPSQILFLLEKDEAVVCCVDISSYNLLLRTLISLEISPDF